MSTYVSKQLQLYFFKTLEKSSFCANFFMTFLSLTHSKKNHDLDISSINYILKLIKSFFEVLLIVNSRLNDRDNLNYVHNAYQ